MKFEIMDSLTSYYSHYANCCVIWSFLPMLFINRYHSIILCKWEFDFVWFFVLMAHIHTHWHSMCASFCFLLPQPRPNLISSFNIALLVASFYFTSIYTGHFVVAVLFRVECNMGDNLWMSVTRRSAYSLNKTLDWSCTMKTSIVIVMINHADGKWKVKS